MVSYGLIQGGKKEKKGILSGKFYKLVDKNTIEIF